ncbi:hypothetical protein Mgra_00008152, partial [Meloidogyne graminicola]
MNFLLIFLLLHYYIKLLPFLSVSLILITPSPFKSFEINSSSIRLSRLNKHLFPFSTESINSKN